MATPDQQNGNDVEPYGVAAAESDAALMPHRTSLARNGADGRISFATMMVAIKNDRLPGNEIDISVSEC
jgi:hypothetical protein